MKTLYLLSLKAVCSPLSLRGRKSKWMAVSIQPIHKTSYISSYSTNWYE